MIMVVAQADSMVLMALLMGVLALVGLLASQAAIEEIGDAKDCDQAGWTEHYTVLRLEQGQNLADQWYPKTRRHLQLCTDCRRTQAEVERADAEVAY